MTDLSSLPASRDAEAADRSYIGLARQIHAMVAAGAFEPGARLPSERSLADQFGVSRTQVREAIIALEVQGIVEVRVGSGIYVSSAADAARPVTFDVPRGPGPIETLRARGLIEAEVAALAATERKDADLDRLFFALTTMREQMNDKAAYHAADREFHLRIAESTGNTVLLHMVTAMWDCARSDPLWDKIEEHFHSTALREASQEDHQRIFAAIMARDAAAARDAMRAHLSRVIAEFTQAWR
ncbi:FadR/GntR family transcriptional regulator [Burkholderia dolosa]|uniref:FadR/GntR family transcriptional regulator n=1 Tax=Burkholderia dolosa TaxID=152500 RepID=UPI001591B18A|nr:FCD domain-containing protein [Burkholderia dolosa]MBR8058097.1 FadR family transcriptional regulator [Burkholderia dolosa]MBR8299499.1 FadR family transcriptional regulator [Burkholderia dolosa]MBR8456240.1 FadR family transcriptional regulator [Burkholderia dolosa]MBY4753955.1 FCD domain-containing protein [Burkholderia dolosa]MBY4832701.1 FCD domain-containing protein [Burkholderia dolosa]